MANKLGMLTELANKVPVLNQKAQAQAEAARQTGMQEQIKQAAQAGPGATTSQVAGALGAQQAAAAGQAQVEGLAQQQQQLQQVGQLGLQEQQQQFEGFLQRQSLVHKESLNSKMNHIAGLGEGLKEQLFDAQLQFQETETGRKFANERQLQDWAIVSAKSQQESAWRMQQMQQASETRIHVMETSTAKMAEVLQRGWIKQQGDLDYEHKKNLKDMVHEMQKEIARKKSRASNRMAVAKGVGTLVGVAAAGAFIVGTGGIGAAAAGGIVAGGAAAGGGLGQMGEASGSFDFIG